MGTARREKTVRLSGEVRGVIAGKLVVYGADGEPHHARMQVGSRVLLYSVDDVSPDALRRGGGKTRWEISVEPRDIEAGLGGNLDREIRRFHGWRGTTCDQSIHAHGVRRVKKIAVLKCGDISVKLGRDLVPEME